MYTPRPLNVLHVLEASTGGTARHVIDVLSHLDRKRFRNFLAVATLRDPQASQDLMALSHYGVDIVSVAMRRRISPLGDAQALGELTRLIRRARVDIVHTHSSKAGILGRVAGKLAGVHTVHTPHGFPFEMKVGAAARWAYWVIEMLAARCTDRLVAVCHNERVVAVSSRLFAPERVELVTNGVEFKAWQDFQSAGQALRDRLEIAPGHRVVGMVGRFDTQKGHRLLVEAAPSLGRQFPDLRFVLVGDGPLKSEIARRIERLGLADRFRILPQTRNVGACYALFDVLAHPSLWEAFPYTLLEAMAIGTPVVASCVGGVGELLEGGTLGMLVPPNDPAALARGIAQLLSDGRAARRLASQARQHVKTCYQLETMIARLESIYEGLGRQGTAQSVRTLIRNDA